MGSLIFRLRYLGRRVRATITKLIYSSAFEVLRRMERGRVRLNEMGCRRLASELSQRSTSSCVKVLEIQRCVLSRVFYNSVISDT